jgi:5-formyltetrahydrofolate cyclo-ligase
MPDPIPELKKQLRQVCLETRSSMGQADRLHASQVICGHIRTWSLFQKAACILTYLPMRGEVDLQPLLQDHPEKNWLLPRILPGSELVLHPYHPDRLIRHPYGMLEPDPSSPVIPASQLDLILTPGLAFDLHGWRLGYGGGFYDRLLNEQRHCPSLGVVYQRLLLLTLPHSDHDIPVHYLVTEDGVKSLISDFSG